MKRRTKLLSAIANVFVLLFASAAYYAAISFGTAFGPSSTPIPNPQQALSHLLSSQLNLTLPQPDRAALLAAITNAKAKDATTSPPFQDPPAWFTPPSNGLDFTALTHATFGTIYSSESTDELFIYWRTT